MDSIKASDKKMLKSWKQLLQQGLEDFPGWNIPRILEFVENLLLVQKRADAEIIRLMHLDNHVDANLGTFKEAQNLGSKKILAQIIKEIN